MVRIKQVIPSEVANPFNVKWKKLIHHAIHANPIHVDRHQLVEVMAVHLHVSACQDTLELRQIAGPNVLSTTIAHLDWLVSITSAKILVLAPVAVSKITFCSL